MQAWKLSWNHLPERSVHSGRRGFLSVQVEHSVRQIYALSIRRFRVRAPDAPPVLTGVMPLIKIKYGLICQ
jgi:hypothetical protein